MEGLILRTYIENQRKPKTQIAKELGMSKQNLYQLFESKKLSEETIKNVESVLKVKWSEIKASVNIDGNISQKKKEAANGQEIDYKDRYIQLLEDRANSNERRMLQLLQRNHALLNAVVETLPKLVSKLDKIKLLEATEEMGKRIEHHLDALKKESI